MAAVDESARASTNAWSWRATVARVSQTMTNRHRASGGHAAPTNPAPSTEANRRFLRGYNTQRPSGRAMVT